MNILLYKLKKRFNNIRTNKGANFFINGLKKLKSNYMIKFIYIPILIGLLFYFFIHVYNRWNKIPYHIIDTYVSANGIISNESNYDFVANIDVGENHSYKYLYNNRLEENNDSFYSSIIFHTNNNYSDTFPYILSRRGEKEVLFKIRKQYQDKIFNKKSYYYVSYHLRSNLNTHFKNPRQDEIPYDCIDRFAYVKMPYMYIDSLWGTNAIGFIISAYHNRDIQYHNHNDTIYNGFALSTINNKPSILSLYDISQANYNIILSNDHINCNSITINFSSPVDFSRMHPNPDITSVSSVVFTDSTAIQTILKNGLFFHVDFLDLKMKATTRIFLLSFILSIVVSFYANILYNVIYYEGKTSIVLRKIRRRKKRKKTTTFKKNN